MRYLILSWHYFYPTKAGFKFLNKTYLHFCFYWIKVFLYMGLNGLLMTSCLFMLDHTKYCVFLTDCLYFHGKLFELSALFFHPQIWGKYPLTFYFLLSDAVSKLFENSSYVGYDDYCSSFPFIWEGTSVDLCVGWRFLWRSGKRETLEYPHSITDSAVMCLREHLWLLCGISNCIFPRRYHTWQVKCKVER